METSLKEIDTDNIDKNIFKLIGSDWMLITAGNIKKYNTMTASWGGFGVLWFKKVCFCVIRPQRFTYEFMEEGKTFTLSFFDGKYKKALEFCGSNSGRDVDKASLTGITPVKGQNDTVHFNEASLVIESKKIYYQDITPKNFILPEIQKYYPDQDYHRMYIGEIVRVLKK